MERSIHRFAESRKGCTLVALFLLLCAFIGNAHLLRADDFVRMKSGNSFTCKVLKYKDRNLIVKLPNGKIRHDHIKHVDRVLFDVALQGKGKIGPSAEQQQTLAEPVGSFTVTDVHVHAKSLDGQVIKLVFETCDNIRPITKDRFSALLKDQKETLYTECDEEARDWLRKRKRSKSPHTVFGRVVTAQQGLGAAWESAPRPTFKPLGHRLLRGFGGSMEYSW